MPNRASSLSRTGFKPEGNNSILSLLLGGNQFDPSLLPQWETNYVQPAMNTAFDINSPYMQSLLQTIRHNAPATYGSSNMDQQYMNTIASTFALPQAQANVSTLQSLIPHMTGYGQLSNANLNDYWDYMNRMFQFGRTPTNTQVQHSNMDIPMPSLYNMTPANNPPLGYISDPSNFIPANPFSSSGSANQGSGGAIGFGAGNEGSKQISTEAQVQANNYNTSYGAMPSSLPSGYSGRKLGNIGGSGQATSAMAQGQRKFNQRQKGKGGVNQYV